MNDLAEAKRVVLEHFEALDAAEDSGLAEALAARTTPGCAFNFTHPFNETVGAEAAAERFWAPLRKAFSPLQRRADIFLAGRNRVDGGQTLWVASMGHYLGLFDEPFLGMRPTRKATMLRYAEFNRVEEGRIAEATLFLDVMNLMALAGAEALPPSTGAVMVTPGPRTCDGLLFGDQPPEDGQCTIDLIMRMIDRLVAAKIRSTETDLSLDWTEDMIWWGPGGIGAPYTQGRYLEQHCLPFEDGLEVGEFFGHRMETGEGRYGGFFGWPTFEARSRGGYVGLAPASEKMATMRVVDLYRREGDKLAENWNFIDHPHFLHQLGFDLVARQKALTGL